MINTDKIIYNTVIESILLYESREMDNKQDKWKKVISNKNGFLVTITKNFQIGKENKQHNSKSITCDYKWEDRYNEV